MQLNPLNRYDLSWFNWALKSWFCWKDKFWTDSKNEEPPASTELEPTCGHHSGSGTLWDQPAELRGDAWWSSPFLRSHNWLSTHVMYAHDVDHNEMFELSSVTSEPNR